MINDKTPKQQAEILLQQLLRGKEVYNIFSDTAKRQITISGKPVDYWEEQFRLIVPTDNLTPTMCKELDMKLMDLNQIATFNYASANLKAQMIKTGSEATYHTKFAALVEEYRGVGKKIPAAATLNTLAKIDTQELESAQALAEMESKYWKGILDHLSTCRKLIENASLNISVEYKAMNNERMLDSLIRKEHEYNYGGNK